jgi:uncharacterized protein YjbI with pentapeptide repeats
MRNYLNKRKVLGLNGNSAHNLETPNLTRHAELEIDVERQRYLAEHLSIGTGLCPFKDVKLCRADVEWLLENHESGRGSVESSDEQQRTRVGLDLRGADLRQANLCNLPLARMLGGRSWVVHFPPVEEQHAVVHLEGADLGGAYLEEAFLGGAYLEEAFLGGAHLEGAYLEGAHLEGAHLEGADLRGANLSRAHLEGANLEGADLQGANLSRAHLEGANLSKAHLEGANLSRAHLEGKPVPADYLKRVRHWDKDILLPANLQEAFFDPTTVLKDAILGEEKYGFVFLADVHWGNVNLSVVDWEFVTMLGDERKARQTSWLYNYLGAVRAYRQLATELGKQGLNEESSRFAYRAHVLRRRVLWRQMLPLRRQGRKGILRLTQKMASYLLSWLLDLFAGYGYKPVRSLVACLLVIGLFTVIDYALGMVYGSHLSWGELLTVSMTAFHGWIFSPHDVELKGPLDLASNVEAFVGLVMEVGLVATFVHRFLRR